MIKLAPSVLFKAVINIMAFSRWSVCTQSSTSCLLVALNVGDESAVTVIHLEIA